MQISNYLQMNDWDIRKFLKVVLAIQLTVWGVIGSNAMGLQIPIIRQLIGFTYLTFIPGIVILRILKLHKLNNIETILYTVGLSIATLMFVGLFMNTVYPFFGISGPISLVPLIITISIVVLVLSVFAYISNKNFSEPSYIDIRNALSPPALFLCLIPILAIFGTYVMNIYQNNILLMIFLVIISIIALLIGFDKFIPKNLYPLAVFVIAISLLYHRSLISMYIWGWDIHGELYFTNLVKMDLLWDPTIYSGLNAMLSLTMLAPIYSIILNMDIIWIFKIIYPLLFSLVPIGLYRVFQKQTNDKIAFLSCFFFVSMFTFYGEMIQLARQQIAELFFVLLILLMIDKNMNKTKRSFLFIVFGISLAVSHYGLSYIYMFSLSVAWLIMISGEKPAIQKVINDFHTKFGRKIEKLARNPNPSKIEDRTVSSTFVLLLFVFTLTWYMSVSSSSAFIAVVQIGDHIASSIFTDFLNPEAAQGYQIIGFLKPETLAGAIHKEVHLISQFFIVIGVFTLLLKQGTMKFEKEYVAFVMVSLALLVGAFAAPYFASALNTSRLYHITLFFLAPFCVIGGLTVFYIVDSVFRASRADQQIEYLKVFSVFLVVFFIFNTGFMHQVFGEMPISISLSSTLDSPRFNQKEIFSAKWLINEKSSGRMYADTNRFFLLNDLEYGQAGRFPDDVDEIQNDSYIFLGTINVVEHKILTFITKGGARIPVYINSNQIVDNRSKIYANGGAEMYYR